MPVNLIIQDPMGNSALVSDTAKKNDFVLDEPDPCDD
jgi:C4-type Zn-finger protein